MLGRTRLGADADNDVDSFGVGRRGICQATVKTAAKGEGFRLCWREDTGFEIEGKLTMMWVVLLFEGRWGSSSDCCGRWRQR